MKKFTTYIPLEERIIFALDVPTSDEAMAWVKRLGNQIKFYKVGLQLFLSGGFEIVDWIIGQGHRLMLDLKFFDVPQTVGLAVAQLRDHGITFATVHGNRPIVRAANKAKGDIKLLAVTVLTSIGDGNTGELGQKETVKELVLLRGRQALELGCDGIVCSGLEVADLRNKLGKDFFIVTPGIRPSRGSKFREDDQKRITTAKQAIVSGADYLVVGRPISRSDYPESVVEELQEEISDALKELGV
jgi:orotidine-5'-phosphate decarboxylase